MMIDTTQIPGYGVDTDPSRRPGVPKEKTPPESFAHAIAPTAQSSEARQFLHARPGKPYPPVYGTAQPPRGLAGRVRGLAYRYPDHLLKHWALLLFADRVDVWTHRVRSPIGLATIATLLLVGGGAAMTMRRRSGMRELPAG